jgi:hypothetical protein
MTNLKNLLATITLSAVIVLGTMTANAGILVSDFANQGNDNPCTANDGVKLDMGIIVAGLTGIIIAGRTGIIVAGRDGIIIAGKDDTTSDCGIIIAGRDGILMSD